MKKLNFQYLQAIAGRDIHTLEDVFGDNRLCKSLWIEFLLNPEIVKESRGYVDRPVVKDALTKALSWHLAFRWLFKKNPQLEELKDRDILSPYSIRGEIYTRDRRNFLKGIMYARLC